MSASTGIVMDDPSNLIPGGTTGLFGAFSAAIIGGILFLRKFLSKDAVERSADVAQKGVIDMLNSQIANQQAQVITERARADKLMAALDDATTQINAMRSQVAALTEQIRVLQSQVTAIAPSHTP